MKIFHSPAHTRHAPDWYVADGAARPCPDNPGRVASLLQSLAQLPNAQILTAEHIDPLPALRAIHTPDYLHYLQTIHAVWAAEFAKDGATAVLPDTFPRPRPHSELRNQTSGPPPRPAKPSAQAGFYCFDMAAPITAGTNDAALASAQCAVAAAQCILEGQPSAYALCRPPGHHAGADYCGGFCYLNNAAAAAQHLLLGGHKKIAIFDIDYHHGNGTQDIFYSRDDVLFVSVHADPHTQYPYFWGYESETGTGRGAGFTRNFPLPRGASATNWFAAFRAALVHIHLYDPDALVVSLGVDTSAVDPVGDFQLTLEDFVSLGRQLKASVPLSTLFIQEGGYHLESIGPSVAAVLSTYG
jgi:acetoin utilization deacetylase AcuC-like enzyme